MKEKAGIYTPFPHKKTRFSIRIPSLDYTYSPVHPRLYRRKPTHIVTIGYTYGHNGRYDYLIMGIVKTLYDLLAQMCKYSFGLIRMEPCYFWVPFKPSHLLPGVDPGVSFDFLHSEV